MRLLARSLVLAAAFLLMPVSIAPTQDAQAQDLATIRADAQLSSMPTRAIGTARTHHFIVDAPGPLGGSNEEINPIERCCYPPWLPAACSSQSV